MLEAPLLFLCELARVISTCGFRDDDADDVPQPPGDARSGVVEAPASEQLRLVAEIEALPFPHAQGRGVGGKLISIGEDAARAPGIAEDVGG